jgi:peptide/nickel transport system substrate-binding protein
MKHFSRSLFVGVAFCALTLAAPSLKAATPSDQLVIGTSLAQVLSLDPQQATEAKANEIMSNLYDRLVASTPDGKIVPQLAESWQVDDKGITFKLREASFASGNPVTSKDVVYSLGRLLKLDQAAAANLKRVGYSKDNVDQLVKAIDDKTVRIELSGDVTSELLLYRLAMVIASVVDSVEVQKHVANDDYGNAWLRTHSAGSGPFTLNRWTPNELVILDANKTYVAGAPKMRRVIVRHVPESQVERLMLERGDIDIASALTASDLATFDNMKGFEIQRVPTGGFYVLSMNAGNKYLSNPKVREAIAYGIDYQGIEKTIMGPYGRARTVPVPVNFEYAIPSPDWHLDYQGERASRRSRFKGWIYDQSEDHRPDAAHRPCHGNPGLACADRHQGRHSAGQRIRHHRGPSRAQFRSPHSADRRLHAECAWSNGAVRIQSRQFSRGKQCRQFRLALGMGYSRADGADGKGLTRA